jgi:manganese-dependent inorganic pyrophosphatase
MKKKILVTAKITLDLDGVASAIAYAQYLNKVKKDAIYEVAFEGHKQIEVGFVFDKIIKLEFPKIKSGDIYDSFILVDSSVQRELPHIVKPDKVIEFIDHRPDPKYEDFPNAKAQIELIGANATLIAEKFYFGNVKLNKKTAILLYISIVSHTINLKSNFTCLRDIRIVKWLESNFKECKRNLVTKIFNFKKEYILKYLKYALESDLKEMSIKNENVAMYQLEVYGIKKVFPDKIKDIIKIMLLNKNVNWGCCTIVDIKEGKTYLVLTDNSKANKIADILGFKKSGEYLYTNNLYLRKEIATKLNHYN